MAKRILTKKKQGVGVKVAITSDLQFDEYARWSKPTGRGTTTRLEDFLACFRWIVQGALDAGCTHLFVLGDIFDSRTTISIPVLDCVVAEFEAAAKKLRVVVLAGNHDSYLRDTTLTSTRVLTGHARTVTTPEVVEVSGGCRFGMVPWSDDPHAVATGVGYVAKKGAHYLFAHAMIKGAVTGAPSGLPITALQHTLFRRVVLGDVHDPIQINKKVQYAGAPLQINYGDVGGKRGYWILHTATDQLVFVENEISPRFHYVTDAKTAKAVREGDFARVKIDDDEEANAVAEQLRDKTPWVEGVVQDIEDDEEDPRLSLSVSDTHADAIAKYAEHQGVGGNKALIDLGLDILTEARV